MNTNILENRKFLLKEFLIKYKSQMKKSTRVVKIAKIYIQITKNNNLITITDYFGNILMRSSSGNRSKLGLGYKGREKRSFYSARGTTYLAVMWARKMFKFTNVIVVFSALRENSNLRKAFEGLMTTGCNVLYIENNTPIAHNGCKRPKYKKPKRRNRKIRADLISYKFINELENEE